MRTLASAMFLGLSLAGCFSKPVPTQVPKIKLEPKFVGSARCAECHASEAEVWKRSHHHEAMRRPTQETVSGDFENAKFDYYGFRSRFFKKGDEYWVETDGPKGLRAKFKVEYTFGFEPLQQYLVRFPDGRLQALSLCWDTREKRWFHLHPEEEIRYQSSLHWTGPQYNWDFMCAECHSTGLQRNYDPHKKTYATTYHEINVACEACHGPGSLHSADPAAGGLPTNLRGRGPWTQGSPPVPTHPKRDSHQVETCARCHARRDVVDEPYVYGQEMGQTRAPVGLEEGVYHADGQIQGEVFEYGSFLQSKMYHAGVVCTDCHDPHTARLKLVGDALCLQCHGANSHSHHQTVNCVDCHMPGKLYMVNDHRRDHSFRIPRPDLSEKLATPNACNACHQDQTTAWATKHFKKWYGTLPEHYGEVLAAGRQGDPQARERLAQLAADSSQPEIVRATAVSLAPYPEVIEPALRAEGSLIRREAVRAAAGFPPEIRLKLLMPLATDPVRSVRIEVGRLLAGNPTESTSVKAAVEEFRKSLQIQAERSEAQLGLAELSLVQGNLEEAEKSLQRAIELAPRSPEPYVNLADLYRLSERDKMGEALLKEAVQQLASPESATVHYALGLLLARGKRMDEALKHLRSAAEINPDDPRLPLGYVLALDAVGQSQKARTEVERALKRHPTNRDLLATQEALSRQ